MPASCEHRHSELRYRFQSDGRKIIQLQCIDCGLAIGPIVGQKDKTTDFLASLQAWDTALQEQTRRGYDAINARRELQRQTETNQWWAWYNSYLRTPQWLYKRERVMDRAGGLCEGCRQARPTEVHHLTYEHVGDELLFELVALCHDCHQKSHRRSAHASKPLEQPPFQ